MNERHLKFLMKMKKDYSDYIYNDIITKLDYIATFNYHFVDNICVILDSYLNEINKKIDSYLEAVNEKR